MNEFMIENTDKEEGRIERIKIKDFARECNLKCYHGDDDQLLTFSTICVNRPGLFIAGFDEYFAASRVQVMGNAEMYYLFGITKEERISIYDKLFSKNIPCLILSRGLKPTQDIIDAAKKHNIPLFLSSKITSEVVNSMVEYLNKLLAPSVSLHGVFVNVNGVGVLLVGESGIGKSETALELVYRGHRLITDDAVMVRRIGNDLVGQAPEVINGFMEIRGVGIIDLERIFGLGSIQSTKNIELIIELEKWIENKEYDRIGKEIHYVEILGKKVPRIVIPVTAGRNLAIVIEVAVGSYRLRQSGYIAADEIEKRMK